MSQDNKFVKVKKCSFYNTEMCECLNKNREQCFNWRYVTYSFALNAIDGLKCNSEGKIIESVTEEGLSLTEIKSGWKILEKILL